VFARLAAAAVPATRGGGRRRSSPPLPPPTTKLTPPSIAFAARTAIRTSKGVRGRRRLTRTIGRAKARIQQKIDIYDVTPLASNSNPLSDRFTFLRNRHPSALVFETSTL